MQCSTNCWHVIANWHYNPAKLMCHLNGSELTLFYASQFVRHKLNIQKEQFPKKIPDCIKILRRDTPFPSRLGPLHMDPKSQHPAPTFEPPDTIKIILNIIEPDLDYFMQKHYAGFVLRVGSNFWLNPSQRKS